MIGCRNGTGGHRFPFTISVSSFGSLMLFNPGCKGGSGVPGHKVSRESQPSLWSSVFPSFLRFKKALFLQFPV